MNLWTKLAARFLNVDEPEVEVERPASSTYERRAPANPPIDEVLQTLLDKYALTYAVVLNTEGSFIAEAGNPLSMTYSQSLTSALLGPYGSAKNTVDFVMSAEILPQGWAQGGDFAILDKIDNGHACIVFGVPASKPAGLDAVTGYYWQKAVSEHFIDMLRPLLYVSHNRDK